MDADVERLYGLTDLITLMAIRVAATLRLADRIAAETTTLTELAADPARIRTRWAGCCATSQPGTSSPSPSRDGLP